jgi:hypothetical protein
LSYIFSEESYHCNWALTECVFLSPFFWFFWFTQFLDAAAYGRDEEMVDLLDQGVNIEFKDNVSQN